MTRVFTLLACILALSLAIGCGDDDDGAGSGAGTESNDGPVSLKVGKLWALTGPYVEGCKMQARAFDLAVKQINERGKVKIDVIESDIGSTNAEAVAGYERARREGPAAVVHCSSSNQAVAIGSAAARDKVVQLATNTDAVKPANPNGFNTIPINEGQLPLANEAFWRAFGSQVKTAAYLKPDDYPTGIASVEARKKFLEGKGVKTVAEESVTTTQRDLRAIVGRVAKAKADVFINDMPVPLVLANQLRDTGYGGLTWGGAGAATTILTKAAPDDMNGWIAFQNWNPALEEKTATAEQFIEDFKAEYGVEPDGFAAAQIDGMLMLEAAALATRSSDPQKLADWMRQNEGPEGVSMAKLKFNEQQGLMAPVILVQVQKDGSHKPIEIEHHAG